MSRKAQFVILALVVVSSVITGCGGEAVVAEVELTPAQVKQQEMDDAAYYNSFVVVFNMITNGSRYAICNGTQKLVSLDEGETRRVKLTSQEALNAVLCKWSEEGGKWSTVQDIGGVGPGDYLLWDTSLHWTRYTPS